MTSQRVERTWICTGGYGRFRGEWVEFKGKGYILYTSDNNTLFLECSGNKFLLMEYHPGIFVNKWTCCDRREKTAQGCQKTFVANEKDGYQGKSKHFVDYYELL